MTQLGKERFGKRQIAMTWALMVGATLVTRMSGDIFIPSIAYMAEDLGVSKAEATSSLSHYYIWLMFSYVLFGRLSDYMSKKKMLLVGGTACLVGCVLCALAPNIIVLIIGRSLQAIATACVLLTAQVWIGSFSDKNNMLSRLAWFSLITTLSPVLAPSIGGFITDSLSWRYNFWLIALLCMLAIPTVGFTKIADDTKNTPVGRLGNLIRQTLSGYWQVLRHSPIERFSLGVQGLFLAQGTFTAISSFLFVQEFGVSATLLGVLLIPIVLGLVVGRFPTLYMRKHYGVRPTFIFNAIIVTVASSTLITYYFVTGTHVIAEVIIMLTVQSIGFNGLNILSLNNSMLVAENNKGLVSGFYNFMNQGASLLGIFMAQTLFSIGLSAVDILQCSACLVLTTILLGSFLFLKAYPSYKNKLE